MTITAASLRRTADEVRKWFKPPCAKLVAFSHFQHHGACGLQVQLPNYIITAEIDHVLRPGDRLQIGLSRDISGRFRWYEVPTGEQAGDDFDTIEEAKAACVSTWGKEGNLTADWL
jgi:hypothetical protein